MSHDGHGEGHGRRRWGLILLGAVLLTLGAVFLVHWVWSAGAGKRLNRQVAAYKAAGEPIEPADLFTAEPLADEDNGAIDLRDAFRSIDQKSEVWALYEKQNLEIPLI